ncbi:amidase [Roseococcus pinisoli]|uniref:Amidase n=1 Tax=Roseococcus pinisoli TaxID=2835040 RepID=A0ABS5Q8W0_9PROT|nr:amidase [Roseococcus pinisoli]MBS7809897.1 amidase [Roseococcus pinisoli]
MIYDRSLINLTAREAVALLRTGKVSPLELVEAAAGRIAEVEPSVNALPILCLDRARDQARAIAGTAARSGDPNWLAGLPLTIKDLDEVAGVRHTSGGSVLFENYVSTKSSPSVELLEGNDGVTLGKSNSPEFGFNASTINELFGPTRNPFDTRLTVGGSSGGAAASVATGEAWMALGSDLGSSIRLPAAFCSVVGLRPSPGRVPRARRGMSFSMLPVVGPITRTVGDCGLMLDAMSGEVWTDPLSLPSAPPGTFGEAAVTPRKPGRVGFSMDLGVTPVDPEVAKVVEAAIARLAAAGAGIEATAPDLSQGRDVFHAIRGVNHLAAFAPLIAQHGERVIPEIHSSTERAAALPIADYAKGENARVAMFQRLMDFLATHEFLICPTAIMTPFPAEWRRVERLGNHEFDSYIDWIAITFTLSLTGCPVISIPCGFTASGMPVGLQILGRPRGEAALLRMAAWCEEVLGALGKAPRDPKVTH